MQHFVLMICSLSADDIRLTAMIYTLRVISCTHSTTNTPQNSPRTAKKTSEEVFPHIINTQCCISSFRKECISSPQVHIITLQRAYHHRRCIVIIVTSQ